ncbi:uncharacterized protein EDB91DRAFT_1243408 [Suillus paluster]|uniref:uncharacterized protein n=1 Tax=Suillus paluster TaxID=48578 RepID=UPI001B8609F0|nr:uncharacterized protein EDB91DRAFT_1243408 [Suillus paluster]KAG1752645.1 hypothetical protein EDB91DRAFT_1243408 [Suillus paluster]
MHLFTPNHVSLIAACYPSSSALVSSGPEYRPNAQELSKLTYYAANRPGKINKLGGELEKRVKSGCHKAQYGNVRARASLLITLSVLRALAVECRRDISLLSPALVACLKVTLDTLSSDLEIVARAASVFTAWCTFTDGHVIGADSNLAQDYFAVLRQFAQQSTADVKSVDHELRNRTRLVGLAALTGAVNSEALYCSSSQYKPQVSIISRSLLFHVMHADLTVLDECAEAIKSNATSIYLAEFRSRPVLERRAASIHAHVDGESGPSSSDVLDTSLRALQHMIQHSNGAQMGFLMQATFEGLGDLKLWEKLDQCRWLAQRACEWAQYQYRYAVPTRLVEQLLSIQDSPICTAQHKALAAMVPAVFTSPVPLVNLSTSDIISNLITLVLRRVSIDPHDALLPSLVECISSLGAHVYYSDQIQDLASELISRLVTVEMQGVTGRDKGPGDRRRSQAIRCLLAGLVGLMHAADGSEVVSNDKNAPHIPLSRTATPQNNVPSQSPPSHVSRRTRVSGEIWHETLSLICDGDYSVRSDYAHTLVSYLRKEIPKRGDMTDEHGVRRPRPLIEGSPTHQANSIGLLLFGDSATRSLHATHAYLFILATTSSLGISFNSTPSPAYSTSGDIPSIGVTAPTPNESGPTDGHSTDPQNSSPARRSPALLARTRKSSNAQRLSESVPEKVSAAASASLSDYALIFHVLSAIHEEVPTRGLLVGLPMLIALHGTAEVEDGTNDASKQRVKVIQELLARVWLVLGRVWECPELVGLAEKVSHFEYYLILGEIIDRQRNQALSTMGAAPTLPPLSEFIPGVLRPAQTEVTFPPIEGEREVSQWSSVNAEEALAILVSSKSVQEATGLDRQGLLRRFSVRWTVDIALRDSDRPNNHRQLTEGGLPLLKLSPALMAIENLSLQSLTRSVRGVGVTDLREALEGRAGASNPALVRRPSVSTLDHSPSLDLRSSRLALTRSRSRPKKRAVTSSAGEVRDVLNRLGIGKQNGSSLLKASFQ